MCLVPQYKIVQYSYNERLQARSKNKTQNPSCNNGDCIWNRSTVGSQTQSAKCSRQDPRFHSSTAADATSYVNGCCCVYSWFVSEPCLTATTRHSSAVSMSKSAAIPKPTITALLEITANRAKARAGSSGSRCGSNWLLRVKKSTFRALITTISGFRLKKLAYNSV
jgi:hypothetical protein